MAETILALSWLVPLLPLGCFLLLALWPAARAPWIAGRLALFGAVVAMLAGLVVAWAWGTEVLGNPEAYPLRSMVAAEYEWLSFTPELVARFGILLDPISVMMLVVIVLVAFPVTLYSIGYMAGDEGFGRFFALLALFVFSMLGLVLATGLLQMFVFWELVGVSSYALIGFWYDKPSAVAASKKAFVVTRFADAFFLLGIIIVANLTGSFDFSVVNAAGSGDSFNGSLFPGLEISSLGLATLLIFIGGWGKSAMFPLHVWLPDAMEGPTPVSSIIHSATMVVAGVFLTARMFPLFAASGTTLPVVMTVGAFTAAFAALVAITQKDIKRILAFSTLSQLGYMMMSLGAAQPAGLGAGAIDPAGFSTAMFHVFTHAFFKCLLFLGAGVIIHAVHSNDLERMGGLRQRLPVTHWTMLAACLAISGVFPLAGYWSKDALLIAAWANGHSLVFLVGLGVSGLTAFYMFRFFLLIFYNRPVQAKGHREPLVMSIPLMLLAVPTVFAGLAGHGFFARYLLPSMPLGSAPAAHFGWIPLAASAAAASGIASAILLYWRQGGVAEKCAALLAVPRRILAAGLYIDHAYLFFSRVLVFRLVAAPVKWFDRRIVDGAMNLVGSALQQGAANVRAAQDGRLTRYLCVTVFGLGLFFLLGYYVNGGF